MNVEQGQVWEELPLGTGVRQYGPYWKVAFTNWDTATIVAVNADGERLPGERRQVSIDDLGSRCRLALPAPHQVIYATGPFAGLTLEKAHLFNNVMRGMEVLVSSNRRAPGEKPDRGVLLDMALPSLQRFSSAEPLSGPWDLRVATHATGDGGYCTSMRTVLTAGIASLFEVVGPKHDPCSHCGGFFPVASMRDHIIDGFFDDEQPYIERLCGPCLRGERD